VTGIITCIEEEDWVRNPKAKPEDCDEEGRTLAVANHKNSTV
jgi:hypothetical protein